MSSFFDKPIKVVAHRGDSMFFPENSIPAFKSAVDIGVDIIETDVHISSDGVIFIWHDENTKKIDGSTKHVTDRTWEDLKSLDIGLIYKDKDGNKPFKDHGLTLMTFKEALETFPTARFNVDLKDKKDELVKGFYEILEEEDAFNRVLVASFHSKNLRAIRKISDRVITSYGQSEVLAAVLLNKVKLTFILKLIHKKLPPIIQVPEAAGIIKVVTRSFIKALHKLGVKIQVWTINDKEDMKRLYKMGVDGVMTDDPRTLMEVAN